jgi:hypothetical protein
MNLNALFIAEMSLFSGLVIVFGLREIWLLTPKQVAKEEAKAEARKQAYYAAEALKASTRHAER